MKHLNFSYCIENIQLVLTWLSTKFKCFPDYINASLKTCSKFNIKCFLKATEMCSDTLNLF